MVGNDRFGQSLTHPTVGFCLMHLVVQKVCFLKQKQSNEKIHIFSSSSTEEPKSRGKTATCGTRATGCRPPSLRGQAYSEMRVIDQSFWQNRSTVLTKVS